jgi:DNA repair photolyase
MTGAVKTVTGIPAPESWRIASSRRDGGARDAGYVTLRLPLEIKDLFREWLAEHVPDRAGRVIKLMQAMHGGADYNSEFGLRQRGSGPYAGQIATRFRLARQRLGLASERLQMRTDLFQRPVQRGQQLNLF